MIRIGFITDEVSQSLSDAIRFAKEFSVSAVELRSVEGKGPFAWTEADVQAFSRELSQNGISVAAISAPLFKCDFSDEKTIAEHIEGFRRCAGFAKILDCRIIRGFDFWEAGISYEERAEKFAEIIDICRQTGCICALEYDPSVHANTPEKLSQLVKTIHSPCVRAVFDPGNGIFSRPDRRPIPGDYRTMQGTFCHLHVKDAVPKGIAAEAVCIGTGVVEYPQLFAMLLQDGYDGYAILETHYRRSTALTDEQLRLPGGSAFSDGAWTASAESMLALKAILATAEREAAQK